MLPEVLAQIQAACTANGRDPKTVRLLAVSKGHTVHEIEQAILRYHSPELHFPLGESRGQELRDKKRLSPEQEWHFIGPLQLNKVKYLQGVRLIHTLERLEQAETIAKYAEKWGEAPAVLLQMHNGESQKHGCAPQDLAHLCKQTRALGLDVRGLMTMAPYDQPEQAAQVFAQAQHWAQNLALPELSMGMSDDFPIAIAHGATIVRVGSALFSSLSYIPSS